jgi:hypothetical protein
MEWSRCNRQTCFTCKLGTVTRKRLRGLALKGWVLLTQRMGAVDPERMRVLALKGWVILVTLKGYEWLCSVALTMHLVTRPYM